MTVKALKKQLMAAIAMVVVALIALSSSTYAWFASNNAVTAKGLTVNATSDSILLQIAGKDDATYQKFGTIGTTTLVNKEMKPTTSFDGKNFAILSGDVRVVSASSAAATWSGEGGAFQAADLVKMDSNNNDYDKYVATARYDLKCETGTVSNVYVKSVDVSVNPTDNKTISNSIRISITCGEKTLIFNPRNGNYLSQVVGETTYTGAGKLLDGGGWTLASPTITSAGTSAIIAESIGADAKEVTVRVWFEGQDNTCYTNNVDTAEMAITIEFATDSTSVTNP